MNWRPVTEWDGVGVATDIIRPADDAPIPYEDSKVTIIWITPAGVARAMHTWNGKRAALEGARDEDLLLAAWPGQRRQDVFVIDDRRKALIALRASAKRSGERS